MTSSILAFISELAERDIRLWLEEGQLRFNAPEGVFTPDIKERVISRKAEIISFLASAQRYTQGLIEKQQRNQALPLSYAQQRLWILDQLDPGSPTYNIPAAFLLSGGLNIELFQKAFELLINRHESLRTIFISEKLEPLQKILTSHKEIGEWWSFDKLTLRADNGEKKQAELITKNALHRFSLSQGPLLKVSLYKKSNDEYLLLLNMHHIISDGQSVRIFLSELAENYKSLLSGSQTQQVDLSIHYADFSVWQRKQLDEKQKQKELLFWREQLKGIEALQLPLDKNRPTVFTERGAAYYFEIPTETFEAFRKIADENGITLFMLFLAAYQLFLSRYSSQKDISIGTPISNRPSSELEGLIGFFGNTLVLRNEIDNSQYFTEFLKQVERNTLAAFSHQELPFEMLVDELVSERDLSNSPLFQSMFTLTQGEERSSGDVISFGDKLSVKIVNTEQKIAKYDFSLSLNVSGKQVSASIEYCVDLFLEESIARMATHFLALLKALAEDSNKKLNEYTFVSQQESKQQIKNWNNTQVEYSTLCLHELFEVQARKSPDACALIFENQSLSYKELSEQSCALANVLVGQGVQVGDGVALCLNRSADMVLALLSVLKCGAYYIPIDPEYPQDRIDYVLEHAESKIVLSNTELKNKINARHKCLMLDELNISASDSKNTVSTIGQKSLMYTIYTSGSTGLPKGVAISHRAFVNFIQGMKNSVGIEAKDKVLCLTSLSFDIAGLEIFLPLVNGATLVMASKEDAVDQDRLKSLVETQAVSLIQATPATWQMLLATDWRKNLNGTEKMKALCGGEALPLALAQKLLTRQLELFNMYGPTETTVWSAVKKINEQDKKIFIGKPINNTQLYVLDEQKQVLPLGAVGELYIAGDGLAEGYLKQSDLTAERFVNNPFKAVDKNTSALMYRTGDLARWTSDGELECLGRIDSQVKVRGFRIELGEIENVIKLQKIVNDAAVVVKSVKGEKQICAFVALSEALNTKDGQDQVTQIKTELTKKLPAYMLPSHITILQELPLTPNGKVDRKALPEPSVQRKEKVSPQNEKQRVLANIWQSVLKVDDISIDDNFFELGGQSLLATQVMSKVRKAFSLDLALKLLFEYPTIRGFENQLDNLTLRQNLQVILPQKRPEKIPLSFSQERLWFLHKLSVSSGNELASSAYHIPLLLRLVGKLDADALEQAIEKIITRHESLRTRFVEYDDQVFQVVDAVSAWQLQSFDARQWSEERTKQEIIRLAQTPFNLSEDALLRVCLFSTGQDEYILLVLMHHIVSDAWSVDILIREVLRVYQSSEEFLPALALQYADYALWQKAYLQEHNLERQLAYWQTELESVPVLQMPSDRPRSLLSKSLGGSVNFSFNEKLSRRLKDYSEQQGLTVFMTLMSALQVLLARYSGQNDFAVGTPIANREQDELQHLIGFFVNTLALRSQIETGQSFVELSKKVKSSLLSAYENQSLPFEILVDALSQQQSLERDLSHSPVFQVMLVLNNKNVNSDIHIEDLSINAYPIERTSAKFDLTLELNEVGNVFTGEWEYSSELFDRSRVESLSSHFEHLLGALLLQPEALWHSLPLLNSEEQAQQLFHWQTAQCDFDARHGLHERFEQQVLATPNALAIVQGTNEFSYADLNSRANQVAHYLVEQGVEVGDVLGVCLPACPDLLVSVLAILKAGATYLPMDVQYPDERLSYFIEDSACTWVLTETAQHTRLSALSTSCQFLNFDTQSTLFEKQPQGNLNLSLSSDALLYVIYTSGSTGLPNRTATTHRKEANLIQWYQRFGMNSDDRLLLLSAMGFDLTQKNLFAPLLCGAAIVLPEQTHYDADSLVASIHNKKVTWLNCAPSTFYPLVELAEDKDSTPLASLRHVFLGGEPIAQARLQMWYETSACQIVNSYGPTECTDVSHFHVLAKDHQEASIPIGHCIPNVKHYVFDEHLQLLPQGAVGELYLGGESVGSGYLNNDVLNQERFIENPYVSGERLYKTGDLVRVRKDGALDYLGRRDFQVKIRGVRIELAEIEQAILKQTELVQACSVIVRDAKADGRSGDDYLCAYVVLDTQKINEQGKHEEENMLAKIKQSLKQKLPVFMQPHYFVLLEALPLTPNGKVDRKQLPIPEQETKVFIAPSTETEIILASIWIEVLGVELVSTQDNFFELGGHSLLATRIVAKVRQRLEKEIPLSKIFECDNLFSLAEYIDSYVDKNKQGFICLEKLDQDKAQPLSYGQQRLWFLEKLNPGTSTYHMPALLELKGKIDIAKFEACIQTLVNEQAVLRTHIVEHLGEAFQKINQKVTFHLEKIDCRESNQADLQKTIESILFKPFKFSEEKLFRLVLIQVAEQEHLLVLVMHHMIADGWSVDVLLQSLLSAYLSHEVQGKTLEHQYIDFAHWQRDYLASESKTISLAYWKEQLQEVSTLELPTDYIRPNISEQKGAKHKFSISKKVSAQVKQWAKDNRASTFMVFFAAYQVLLARMSGQKDFAIGTPIANRNHETLENVIGFFVNTLALPAKLENTMSFQDLVNEVKAQSLEAQEHQWLPFEYIVDELGVERSLNRSPIFQAMFVLQESAFASTLDVLNDKQSFSVQATDFSVAEQYIHSKFEITLEISEGKAGFEASFEYDRALFSQPSIKLYADYFSYLLNELLNHSEENVFSLPMENPELSQKHIVDFNDNARVYPRDLSLIDIFEQSVTKHAKRIALQDDVRQLTYLELDALANNFGERLLHIGIQAQDRVALYFDRGIDFVIALLACHKISAVYVPVNPDYPKERRDYILKDSAASALIYQREAEAQALEDGETFPKLRLIPLNDDLLNESKGIGKPKRKSSHASTCAAVLYTSGSTGEPKGVQLTHRGIARLVLNSNYFSVDENDCFPLINNICFDASSFEIWGALLNGAKAVVFGPDVVLSPNEFKKQNYLHKASCMLVPTGLFHNTVAENPSTFLGVKYLLIGGEAVDIQLAHQVLNHSKPEHFINVYGPTENATITTTWEIGGIKKPGQKVNIGAPIANTSVYIVDEDMKLMPIGVPGELLCAGDGLSLGYQNKNTPNQKSFIDHPFPELEKNITPQDNNLKAYRSGDFARFLPNGELEFLGRIDQQVKIRGYRVEPDEVAAVINGIDFIEHATVVARANKKSHTQALHLVAYFVPTLGAAKDGIEVQLKEKLMELLPTYLVPSLCVRLDEIPLTPNGKIDRRALPEPNWQAMSKAVYVAPVTDLQKQIAEIWKNLLGLEKVGLSENFFEIGGNSLSATRVISQCSQVSGSDIPLRTLFEAPVLKSFCEALEDSKYSALSLIEKANRNSALSLSFGQQRLWFLDQLNEGSAAYHIPFALKIDGILDTRKLASSFEVLIQRHEILRTNFVSFTEAGAVQQIIKPTSTFQLIEIDAREFSESQIQKHIQFSAASSFDLSQDVLLRASIYQKSESSAVLLLVMHHIIGDAWSLEILAEELFQVYMGAALEDLPVLDIQYADYAQWQQEERQLTDLTAALNFWEKTLIDVPVLQLPLDKSRPLVEGHRGASVPIKIEAKFYEKLKLLGEKEGSTMFMSLLSVFQILLARYSGQADFAVGTPIANRNHPQVENLIGFFANTLAIRSDYADAQSFSELLSLVKERTLAAYSHQQVPFEQVVDALQVERNLSHSPVFQVMLVVNAQALKSHRFASDEFSVSTFESKRESAKFDLTLELSELENSLEGLFEYNTDIFERSTIENLSKHFLRLLELILENPDQAIRRVNFLDYQDINKLTLWSAGESENYQLTQKQSLAHLISEQCVSHHDSIALKHHEKTYSYAEFEKQSNRLANYLVEQGVQKGDFIGICLEQSTDIALAVYSVLKIGAAYIPFDPSFPEERISKVHKASNFKYLLKHKSISLNLSCQSLNIDDSSLWNKCSEHYVLPVLTTSDLAYVIYTSGSTGEPKGVAIEHGSLLNYLCWAKNYYKISDLDISLCSLPLSFDAVISTLFLPLLAGKTLEFADRGCDLLDTYLSKKTNINYLLKLTPAHLNFYQSSLRSKKDIYEEKHRFIVGGDQLRYQDIQYFLSAYPNSIFTNEYGPTESTVGCVVEDFCFKNLSKTQLQTLAASPSLLIGKPIANTEIYILDENQQLLAPGLIGELCIAGAGLARSYLNNELATKTSFINFQDRRIYRSGDLARYRPDGKLQCLGRIDNQIKLRGVRIELGEIEQALLSCVEVKDAHIVFDKQDNVERLIAYMLCSEENLNSIKVRVEKLLPPMMRPSNYVCLENFPLTENGKLDVKRLVIPERQEKVFVAPSSETEIALAAIWQEVLGVEKIGTQDNFFELGGHSLLATRVLSKLKMTLKKDISLVSLFEHPELAELAHFLDGLALGGGLDLIPVVDRNEPLLLSYSQQRIWFLEQLSPGSSFYHMPAVLKLTGQFDSERFESCVQLIINRHESLRTNFQTMDDEAEPQQIIQDHIDWQLNRIALMDGDEESVKHKAAELLGLPFDLSSGVLLRMHLLQVDSETYYLLSVMHHIISDGWSIEVLLKEILSAYLLGESSLPELAIQYADFSHWQRTQLTALLDEQEKYWCGQLKDVPSLQLPLDYSRPIIESHRGETIEFVLAKDESEALRTFSESHGVTLFMTVMAAFQVLLARYSGQDDFAVGTPIANRNHPQLENLIGCFINTLAIRATIEHQLTFKDILANVKRSSLEAFDRQELPFEKIVDALSRTENIERNLSQSPIFQVMLLVNNTAGNKAKRDALFNGIDTGDLQVSMIEAENHTAKFDLTLELSEEAFADASLGFSGHLEYNTDLFAESTAQQFIQHFKYLLHALLAQPDLPLYALPLLNAEEQAEQLLHWQSKRVAYDNEHCLHTRFEHQVVATPTALALVQGGKHLSYLELNQRANQLAHYLIEQGVQVGDVLGVCLPACPELLVSVLAILKAGGTYLPMDVQYPDERLGYFIEDSGCTWVLTEGAQRARLLQTDMANPASQSQCRLLSVDTERSLFENHSQDNVNLSLSADNLLYVIYTSGSTGLPNRTATTHQKEVNLLQWYQGFGMGSHDRLLLLSAIGFDLTQKNLFAPLLSGSAIVFPEQVYYDAESLVNIIHQQQVTWLNCAPSAFYPLVALAEGEVQTRLLASLRYVFLGGEPISAARIQPWYRRSECQIVNSYGPTECTDVSHFHVLAKDHKGANIPIGLTIPNVTQYVFDEHLQLVPQGVVGELYLGGDSVGPGYLNNEVLNQARFIENPYVEGERLYKTGDLVRVRKDGALDYLGRRDFQVKIRGVRIELGEIEQAILADALVEACTVIVRNAEEDGSLGDDYLCAYLAFDEALAQDEGFDAAKQVAQIKQALKQSLPVFMQPHYFEVLGALPLTPNGKVDRKRLPIPAKQEKVFVAPSSETEIALAEIWQEVLGVEKIGTQDNFFELGGHSLLATRVLSKLKMTLKKDISLVSLFEHPELAELAHFLDGLALGGGLDLIPVVDRNEPLLLSYSQQRIWFLEQLSPGSSFYHMPAVLKLTGQFDSERFESCVQLIINRHESLRTNFQTMDDEAEPQQIIQDHIDWQLNRVALMDGDEESVKHKAAELLLAPFDLSAGPLFRMHLLKLDEENYYLLSVMHHIISDGWSIEVLLKEIMSAYLLGESSLPKLDIQYADYAYWQRTQLSEVLNQQEAYWCEQLADVPALQLPNDHIRPPVESHRGAVLAFTFDIPFSKDIKSYAEKSGATLFMTLMAAYQVLLSRYSGQDDFAVGTPIANRNHPQLENLIGCFINTLAIRANLNQAQNFKDVVANVKQTTLAAFSHQELPFEKIVEALSKKEGLERNLSHAPIYQVMLVVNNQTLADNRFVGVDNAELEVTTVDAEHQTAKFDLNLEVSDMGEQLGGHLEYNTDLFDKETAEQMLSHFKILLEKLIKNNERPLQTIDFLQAKEQSLLIEYSQGEIVTYPVYENVSEYLSSALVKHSDEIALRFEGEELTYTDLHARSERLASYLQTMDLKTAAPVALCLDRSAEMVVSLLAVLKSGSPYLPLDPELPQERLDFMLADSGAQFVLTQETYADRFTHASALNISVLNLSDTTLQKMISASARPVTNHAKPEDLFNIIYTSGSTGNPKGVMVTYAGILNRIQWMQSEYGLKPKDKILQKTTYSFDVSVWEFIWPLSQGASLVLAKPEGHKDPEYLSALIQRENISHCHFVPSMLLTWLEQEGLGKLTSLQKVFCSGEALSREAVNQFYQALPHCELHNLYGPTEAAIDVSYWHCEKDLDSQCMVPIGRPVANTQLWVLDAQGNLLPPGVAGELHISGVQLARGYLNRDDLNKAIFIEHNINGHTQRLYKTGDLVRQRRDGVIDYLGRIDHQVKIRGYRIELGEIESRLQSIEGVALSVVVAAQLQANNPEQLVAYLSTHQAIVDKENFLQKIKIELGKHLPAYMVPSVIMLLDEMPLLGNGKINRKRLPKAEIEQAQFIAPSTETEIALAEIWTEVLGVEEIGILDNFFDLGGHSLLATRIVAKVRNVFQVELELRLIFELKSLEEMAALISTMQNLTQNNERSEDDLEEIDL